MDEQEAVSRLVEFAMGAMDRNGVRPPALVEAVEVGSRLADELRRGPTPPPAPPSSAAAELRVESRERSESRYAAAQAAFYRSADPSYRRRTVAPRPATDQRAAVRDVAARRAANPNWA
jgi:hypothetical protein